MEENSDNPKKRRPTLFPIKQKNGTVIFYCSDFSEYLGSGGAADVYKGYRCDLKVTSNKEVPFLANEEDLVINQSAPVAIKLYKNGQKPSLYRKNTAGSATLMSEDGRAILITEFIDGFEIQPEFDDNPEIKKFTFFQAVDAAWQLVIGLNQLHYRNTKGRAVVHGDIKGSNVKIKLSKHDVNDETKGQLDVYYIDDDYSTLISLQHQDSKGTPEHVALEVLEGLYSEASDFYALGPLLLTLFGAKNPFKNIFSFKAQNPTMKSFDLVKHYVDIGFCSEGMFEHFSPKPELEICNLVKTFIKRIVAKDKKQRPLPEAILEFFTALRQLCLSTDNTMANLYKLRLAIASNEASWLTDKTKTALFFTLHLGMQKELIHLMSANEHRQLFESIYTEKEVPLYQALQNHLSKIILAELIQNNGFANRSWISSLFASVPLKEMQWLLRCIEEKNYQEFSSPQRANFVKTLKLCKQKEIAAVINVVIAQLVEDASCEETLINCKCVLVQQ